MTIEQLREARDVRPFRPFEIRMADGRALTVRHPDNIVWDEESRTAVCLADRAWVMIDVDLITSLSTPLTDRPKKARKS
jgi:hypothetical protein